MKKRMRVTLHLPQGTRVLRSLLVVVVVAGLLWEMLLPELLQEDLLPNLKNSGIHSYPAFLEYLAFRAFPAFPASLNISIFINKIFLKSTILFLY